MVAFCGCDRFPRPRRQIFAGPAYHEHASGGFRDFGLRGERLHHSRGRATRGAGRRGRCPYPCPRLRATHASAPRRLRADASAGTGAGADARDAACRSSRAPQRCPLRRAPITATPAPLGWGRAPHAPTSAKGQAPRATGARLVSQHREGAVTRVRSWAATSTGRASRRSPQRPNPRRFADPIVDRALTKPRPEWR